MTTIQQIVNRLIELTQQGKLDWHDGIHPNAVDCTVDGVKLRINCSGTLMQYTSPGIYQPLSEPYVSYVELYDHAKTSAQMHSNRVRQEYQQLLLQKLDGIQ